MNCANCNKQIIPCKEKKCNYQGYIHKTDGQHSCDWNYNKTHLSAKPKK